MRPDEMRRHGAALAERVRREVDTPLRLDLLLRRHRRGRRLGYAAAAVAVVVLVVGTLWTTAADSPPVVIEPPTTMPSANPDPQALPVEVYLALLDEFVVESEEPAGCTGTGVHAGIGPGIRVSVVDDRPDRTPQVVAESVIAETGALIETARIEELGLPTAGTACLFELMTTSIALDRVGSLRIDALPWPPPGGFEAGASRAGQQYVFYSKGMSP